MAPSVRITWEQRNAKRTCQTRLGGYLGCTLTMAIVPHSQALVLYNSMLHEFDVAPILRPSVLIDEAVLGLIATFIGCGLAGGMIAGFYNWGLHKTV